jgi:MoaA/NifB/PqqE/SkfB family radical SAM enzyme
MARAVRAQGLKVSLTTNGFWLNERVQMRVLEHFDMVAISLDGARAETSGKKG